MTSKTQYLSCADTAKLVRKALKAEFPGVKFSVRSSTCAGGASIDVGWTDGPTTRSVDSVLKLYQGATFDGMIDLKSYHQSLLANPDGTVDEVHFGADFVMGQRDISAEWRAELQAEVEEATGEAFDPQGRYPFKAPSQYQVGEFPGLGHCHWEKEYGSTLVCQLAQYRDRTRVAKT